MIGLSSIGTEEMLITKAMLGSVMEEWFQDWHDGKTISSEECFSLSVEHAAELATNQVWEALRKYEEDSFEEPTYNNEVI